MWFHGNKGIVLTKIKMITCSLRVVTGKGNYGFRTSKQKFAMVRTIQYTGSNAFMRLIHTRLSILLGRENIETHNVLMKNKTVTINGE